MARSSLGRGPWDEQVASSFLKLHRNPAYSAGRAGASPVHPSRCLIGPVLENVGRLLGRYAKPNSKPTACKEATRKMCM